MEGSAEKVRQMLSDSITIDITGRISGFDGSHQTCICVHCRYAAAYFCSRFDYLITQIITNEYHHISIREVEIALIVSWVDSAYRLHIYMDSEIGCKVFTFLAHLSDFNCVWMISWISCDRMVVLYRPVSDHYFLFTLLDTAICTLLPAILIMFVNTLSIYRYRQCMRIYSSGVLRVRFDRASNGNPIPYEETTAKKLLLSQTHTNSHMSTQSNRSTCGKLRSSDLQLSRTLLIVTSTFVLLNVPSYMVRIIQYIFEPRTQIFHFLHYFSYLIYYLHHAVLFYMYIFWSPQMKKQLKPTAMRLLECYCFKTVPEFGHRSTSLQGFN
ncbi:hypothetical protein COOONC_10624 [Cooperia oncophora]